MSVKEIPETRKTIYVINVTEIGINGRVTAYSTLAFEDMKHAERYARELRAVSDHERMISISSILLADKYPGSLRAKKGTSWFKD